MESPAFSSFRNIMDIWDEAAGTMKIKSLIDTNSLVLFIEKDGKIYGAPESSRLVFAKMKNPDDDIKWAKDANFTVFDLGQALKGKRIQAIMTYKDLNSIKVLDEDKIIKKLGKNSKDIEPADLDGEEDDPTAPDAPSNMAKLGEK